MKKTISLLLSFVIVLTMTAGFGIVANATDYQNSTVSAVDLQSGDTFQMGNYPKTKVTDASLLSQLSTIDCDMISYGYANEMYYADFYYNGVAYRKVKIIESRPISSQHVGSVQSSNGYIAGATYYFKWEPIVWRVMAKETDGVYVLSDVLLDAQGYHKNSKDEVTWETCDLRKWLNDNFYKSAFTSNEKAKINTITHSNDNSPNGLSSGNDTTDNIWLLSYSEMENANYGLDQEKSSSTFPYGRRAFCTDYAKCQGIQASTDNGLNNVASWRLRTVGKEIGRSCYVEWAGSLYETTYNDTTMLGIRPALKIKLTAEITASDEVHIHNYVLSSTTDATCLENGEKVYTCSCGDIKTEVINALGHNEVPMTPITATCTHVGYTGGTKCDRCGITLVEPTEVPITDHDLGNWQINTAATCSTEGTKIRFCNNCDYYESEKITTIPHTPSEAVIENKKAATCTAKGSYESVVYCAKCSAEISRDIIELDIVDHKPVVDSAVEPTCATSGKTAGSHCSVCGEILVAQNTIPATENHASDNGTVTKSATTLSTGTKTYKCKVCGKVLKTETLPKLNAEEAVGKGATEEAVNIAITTANTEEPKGTAFGVLQAKSSKVTNKSVQLKWSKVNGAKKYLVYGNKCGKGNKYIKLTSTSKTTATYKKIAGKKVKKGTYYKFIVVALDKENKVISTSKTIHVATSGGKVGNDKKVTTAAKKNKVTIKKGKTFKLKAKAIPASKKLKVKKHRKMSYETSNSDIAIIDSKGVVKAKKKGTCYVYAYAQNGVYAKIKITVK